jgi:hypothetical protein
VSRLFQCDYSDDVPSLAQSFIKQKKSDYDTDRNDNRYILSTHSKSLLITFSKHAEQFSQIRKKSRDQEKEKSVEKEKGTQSIFSVIF